LKSYDKFSQINRNLKNYEAISNKIMMLA